MLMMSNSLEFSSYSGHENFWISVFFWGSLLKMESWTSWRQFLNPKILGMFTLSLRARSWLILDPLPRFAPVVLRLFLRVFHVPLQATSAPTQANKCSSAKLRAALPSNRQQKTMRWRKRAEQDQSHGEERGKSPRALIEKLRQEWEKNEKKAWKI